MDSLINYIFVYILMQSDRNSWKIDTFQEAITSELIIASESKSESESEPESHTENSYSSVSVSSKSYVLLITCLNVLFISCRLMKSFRTVLTLIASHCRSMPNISKRLVRVAWTEEDKISRLVYIFI